MQDFNDGDEVRVKDGTPRTTTKYVGHTGVVSVDDAGTRFVTWDDGAVLRLSPYSRVVELVRTRRQVEEELEAAEKVRAATEVLNSSPEHVYNQALPKGEVEPEPDTAVLDGTLGLNWHDQDWESSYVAGRRDVKYSPSLDEAIELQPDGSWAVLPKLYDRKDIEIEGQVTVPEDEGWWDVEDVEYFAIKDEHQDRYLTRLERLGLEVRVQLRRKR